MFSQLTLLPIILATSAVLAAPTTTSSVLGANDFQVSTFGSLDCQEPALRNNFVEENSTGTFNIPNALSASLDPDIGFHQCEEATIKYYGQVNCTGAMILEEKAAINGPTCHNLPKINHQCAMFTCSKTNPGLSTEP